jgi:hypothetical protein
MFIRFITWSNTKMVKGKIISFYLSSSFILLATANAAFADSNKLDIYVSGGPFSSRLGNSSALQVNSFVVNDYNTNEQSNWSTLWGGGIGHTFENIFNKPISISLGLAGYGMNFGNVKGIEYPFINNDIYDTLNYQFYAQSSAAMVETRVLYSNYSWQPYAIVGVGAAWNRLSDYNEVPTDPALSAAPVSPTFGNHTTSAFAYEAGIGVQRVLYEDVNNNVRYTGSLDYRYVNFGKAQLGTMPSETTNQVIQVNNLSTQGAMFTLKVSFC